MNKTTWIQIVYQSCSPILVYFLFFFFFDAAIKSQISFLCQLTYKNYKLNCDSFIHLDSRRINNESKNRRFARSTETNTTSAYTVCEEGKKREIAVQGVGLVYSPVQRRAKTKRITPTRGRSLWSFREAVSRRIRPKRGSRLHTNECHLTIRLVG